MRAALEQEHAPARERPRHELARMAGHAAPRKLRDIAVGQDQRILDFVGKGPEPRAEDEGGIETAVEAAGTDELDRLLDVWLHRYHFAEAPKLSGPNEMGNSSSSVKLFRTPSGPATWMGVFPAANSRMR
jgi:hypothetical protein